MSAEIPLVADPTSYTLETILDGASYRLTVRWNARDSSWYLHLEDVAGVLVVGSLKLVADWPILRLVPQDGRRPPGELYLVDSQGGGDVPTLLALGDRYRLIYFTEAEVEASLG